MAARAKSSSSSSASAGGCGCFSTIFFFIFLWFLFFGLTWNNTKYEIGCNTDRGVTIEETHYGD